MKLAITMIRVFSVIFFILGVVGLFYSISVSQSFENVLLTLISTGFMLYISIRMFGSTF